MAASAEASAAVSGEARAAQIAHALTTCTHMRAHTCTRTHACLYTRVHTHTRTHTPAHTHTISGSDRCIETQERLLLPSTSWEHPVSSAPTPGPRPRSQDSWSGHGSPLPGPQPLASRLRNPGLSVPSTRTGAPPGSEVAGEHHGPRLPPAPLGRLGCCRDGGAAVGVQGWGAGMGCRDGVQGWGREGGCRHTSGGAITLMTAQSSKPAMHPQALPTQTQGSAQARGVSCAVCAGEGPVLNE